MAIVQETTGLGGGFSPSLTWSSIQMLRGSRAYMDVIENPELLLALCEKIYDSQLDYYDPYWVELIEKHQSEGVQVIAVNGS